MVTLIKYGAAGGGAKYNTNVMTIDGLSTDTKPTEVGGTVVPNGSKFVEIDTGKTFMYDGEGDTWYEVSLGGGGGYSKDEIDALLEEKADLDEDGMIPLSQIPPSAMEHMVTVANDTARFALTTDDVQNGDTVYVSGTETMYMVVDDTKLNVEAGYQSYAAKTASRAIADKNGDDITTTYVKPTSYATQTTGGTAKMWTTVESGETTLNISTQ